jgi:hypothetical protein
MSKKPPTNEQLISLARLAPKVEWSENPEEQKEITSPVFEFLDVLGVTGGRFEVGIKDLFHLFQSWDTEGLTYRQFRKALKTYVKFDSRLVKCKLNRQLITIQRKLKEVTNGNEEE